jgi:ATPase subunit of ABC transporter with duplicated ATPase domains
MLKYCVFPVFQDSPVLTASSITLQFAAKPLFENVNVKFGDGNRYGLIGANGCGKSTFMKILAGELEPTAGNVSLDPGERMAWLRQDEFGYESSACSTWCCRATPRCGG